MAIDPVLLITFIITGSFFITFLGTYLLISRMGKEKEEESYEAVKPKKLSKKGRSLLDRNIVDELIETIPVGSLDPSTLIELEEIFHNGLMNVRKEKSHPEKLIEGLKEMRNAVEQWVVHQGASNFEISKLVYDFFFDWYNSVETELY